MNDSLTIGAEVARGALATVHRGARNGRTVAVKRALDVPGAAAALRREARVLATARHPAIVPVLDLLDDEDTPAIVLGWADGGSLHDLLADGPLDAADLLHLLRPLAGGLDAMHRAGVAHLDVTVHNVLLAAAGPILVDPAPPGAGTPGFADPAVVAGGPASARSDVFGLAACAHVAITGRPARAAGGLAVGTALPRPVAAALAAALHPDPRRRPASASAFVDALEEALRADAQLPDRAAAPAGGGPAGRPVVRACGTPAGCPRTWPFDRWAEEAASAEERTRALAAVIGASSSSGRRRPWRLRTSALDSTQRPPAPRPPPAATLGGKP